MYDFGKIRFTQEFDDRKIEMEIRGDSTISEVVEEFEMFLKGAGYQFDGHLDFVDEDEGLDLGSIDTTIDFSDQMSFTFDPGTSPVYYGMDDSPYDVNITFGDSK